MMLQKTEYFIKCTGLTKFVRHLRTRKTKHTKISALCPDTEHQDTFNLNPQDNQLNNQAEDYRDVNVNLGWKKNQEFSQSETFNRQNHLTYKRPSQERSRLNPVSQSQDLFEVTELKPKEETQKEPKKLLGKDIAEDIRANKKNEETNQQHPYTRNSIKHPDLTRTSHVEFAKLLRKRVIYADENLAIFSKPYGVAAHDGDNQHMNLKSCFSILSKMIYGLNTSIPLLLCNRLDKSTTGVTVCATNQDLASEIKKLFRQQKVRRKYWAVTVGEPEPRQGILDMPMTLRHVDGGRMFKSHQRMGLALEQKIDYQTGKMIDVKPRKPHIAITHYRILDINGGLALVEFQPLSTVKHQIRVHAAEGLSCCILGDHKYSQHDKLLPQRLPKNILSRFDIRPTKSRDMPMHLHLREIVIPGILENTAEPNLLVSAKLPEHIYNTTKLFGLKPGAMTDFKYPRRLIPESRRTKNNPLMEKLYQDPFEDKSKSNENDERIQRDDCYTVYRPKSKVKFQYHNKSSNNEFEKDTKKITDIP